MAQTDNMAMAPLMIYFQFFPDPTQDDPSE